MDNIAHFLASIDNENQKQDSQALLTILTEESGYPPHLNGSIIGFGRYHYRYDSGHEGDADVVSFSPRKQHLVVYIMPGFEDIQTLLNDLGKHKMGKSCLYIKKLADIDINILKKIISYSVKEMQRRYDCQHS